MVISTKKFGTLDPHLPIIWDKVPKKNVFFDTFPKTLIGITSCVLLALKCEEICKDFPEEQK